jgi:sec-independent protein translocase protein TatA
LDKESNMVFPPQLTLPLALGFPGGPGEWILIAGIALLLFGKRLPEVGRSLGKGIVEFKKGLKGIEDEVETAAAVPDNTAARAQIAQQSPAPAQHRFDPYTGKPLDGTTPTSTPPSGT